MTTTLPKLELVDYVRELTQPHTHAEHYTIKRGRTWYGGNHVTKVPPLIRQLWDAPEPSSTTEDGPRPGFASRPAARLDSLDVAFLIDKEASDWVRELGEDDPADSLDRSTGRFLPGSGTIACVQLLHSLLPAAHDVTRKQVTRDVRRWWTQARIVTGWDSPPWKPDNTCPMCGTRGELKVNLALQVGFCQSCRSTWEPGTIGLLADHIRGESEAERQPRTPREACWCPMPKPIVTGLVLCPVCGSARCSHAIEEAARLAALRAEAREKAS